MLRDLRKELGALFHAQSKELCRQAQACCGSPGADLGDCVDQKRLSSSLGALE